MTDAPAADVVSADAIVDAPVVNAAGDEVGRLAYVMLDVAEGRVAYAVLAHGGVLGLGEQLFAVPWHSLRHDATRERFVLEAVGEEMPAIAPLEAPTDL